MSAPLTLLGTIVGRVTNGTMAGVLMNGITKVGNKRMRLPQAHFHLEVWMSVPPVVRGGLNRVKMNVDTGAAVNTFPLNFGPGGAGDGRFFRTASGEWIPDGPRIRRKRIA